MANVKYDINQFYKTHILDFIRTTKWRKNIVIKYLKKTQLQAIHPIYIDVNSLVSDKPEQR